MIPPQETVLQRPYQCDRRRPSRGHPGGQDGRQGESDRSREEAWPGQGRAWWAGPGRWAGPGGQPTASPSQSASSERSWQSASPSQRSRRSTHWPRAQGNWAAEHTGQPSSSLWSSHSGKPSQRQAPGMQSISPVAQANWSGEQVGGSGEDRKTVTRRPAQRRKNRGRAPGAAPAASALRASCLLPQPGGSRGHVFAERRHECSLEGRGADWGPDLQAAGTAPGTGGKVLGWGAAGTAVCVHMAGPRLSTCCTRSAGSRRVRRQHPHLSLAGRLEQWACASVGGRHTRGHSAGWQRTCAPC